jgi:hypothetical protein
MALPSGDPSVRGTQPHPVEAQCEGICLGDEPALQKSDLVKEVNYSLAKASAGSAEKGIPQCPNSLSVKSEVAGSHLRPTEGAHAKSDACQ